MISKRGRKSKAEIEARVIQGQFGKRPEPPEQLTPRQQEIWRETLAGELAELIGTAATRAILADYCRHREAVENVCSVIDTFRPEWLKNAEGAARYFQLLKMRDQETTAAARMATKLRLTNQSRYLPQTVGRAAHNTPKIVKPWET